MRNAHNEIKVTRTTLITKVMSGQNISNIIPYIRPNDIIKEIEKDYGDGFYSSDITLCRIG